MRILNFFFSFCLITPIILSSVIYYYFGFKYFGANFNPYIFTSNLTFDENVHYFLKILNFISYLGSNLNDVKNYNNINFVQIVPYFFSFLVVIIFGENSAPILIDLITIIFFLAVNYYFFLKILKIKKNYLFSLLVIYSVFFSYGPFTYNFYIDLFKDIELKTYHQLFRQFSPSLTYIFFIINIIAHCKSYKSNQITLLNFSIIALSYFVYSYNSVVQIIFFSLCFFYLILLNNKKKIIIKLYLINIFMFLIWFYLHNYYFNNEWFTKFLLGYTETFNLEIEKNLITIFFLIINFYIFYKYKIFNFLFVAIFLLACFIFFNLRFIIGYDLQLYHVDMYFTKPAQWLSLILLIDLVMKKNLKKLLVIIAFSISILFFWSHKNFSEKLILNNLELINEQLKKRVSFAKINKFVKNEIVYTLDPHFIAYGYYLSSSKSYIISIDQNLVDASPKKNLINFIDLGDFLGITRDTQYKFITDKSLFYLNDKHNFFQHLLFLQDNPANDTMFKDSINEGVSTNIKEFIENKNQNKIDANIKYLLIYKKDQKFFNYIINKNLKVIYEDENYFLYEKYTS
jgi:hypothetical protein